MGSIQFVFDIIVTYLESTAVKIADPSKLLVNATFGSARVALRASSINVNEFKPGAGVNFTASPKKLRKSIAECGLPITVTYNAKVIGAGEIMLPENIINKIDVGMSDLTHVQGCSIEKDGEAVGNLEILFRLIIKCEENPKADETTCSVNMDKSINRQDIMFLVSNSQRCPLPCDPCLDVLEPDEGDDRLKLDLQRYQSSNAGGFRADTLIHNPVGNSACCQLKKMAQECEEIVDSINKRVGQPISLKPPCRGTEEQCYPCVDPGQNFLPDSTGPCFSYLPARQGDSPDFCDPALIPVPISDLNNPSVKPARFCPVCLTNMGWMPKFAACPKCGIKPMPVVEERHKKLKLTSEQIILEFLGKSNDISGDFCNDPCDSTKNGEDECRCTCKFGKFCAHCRIRQLSADIFQASKNEVKCPTVKPKSSEDFCVLKEEPKACRPYLAHVFSELRDLYSVKDESSQLRIQCAKMPSFKNQKSFEKNTKCEKNTRKKKTTERKTTGLGAAHKSCMDRKGGVARHHGWAWGLREEASKNGWRPGSVRKSVKRLMKFFLDHSTKDNAFNNCKKAEEVEEERNRQQPTLHVCKKNGELVVTLRALNNPTMQMKPIVFNLVKSDLAVALRDIKKKLKDKGYRKCTCHQPLMMCVCRNMIEKKQLEDALQRECLHRGMENCVEHLVLTDTSESEVEFEFDVTPPAAMAKPPCAAKSRTVNIASQTNKKDLVVPSKYPIKLNPYWRAYDCAAGDRYTGTAFGKPGEAVFEDGVFGHQGGGPHGPSASPGGKAKTKDVWGASPGGPMRGGGGRGGKGGAGGGGGAGGKLMPPGKSKPGAGGKSAPIPVRMPKRHVEGIKQAAKDKEDAIKNEIAQKKKGINLMKYLMEKGTIPTPWDPNNPQPKKPVQSGPVVGPDGLTDAQRKRRALQQMCVPPLDSMPRLGKGFDPCQCYSACCMQCAYPCCYCG